MSGNRIDAVFRRLAEQKRTALIPYVTAGYPDLEATCGLVRRFDEARAAAVEIGFPFSDSIADGAVIQDSFHRVLSGGQRVDELFEAVGRVRGSVALPLIAMVSYSIVERAGLQCFVDRAVQVGFDGLIAPDVPMEEAQQVLDAADSAGLRNIMLVATTTPPERAGQIVDLCTGFVYQVAVAGPTGERSGLAHDLAANVRRLRGLTGLPICVGFGISNPDQVRQAGDIADGVIVGSAIVRRITEGIEAGMARSELVESVATFVTDLIAAT
jgi:tryptophan synthase alpha chain